jgi:glucose/arabinose dehydrogenase
MWRSNSDRALPGRGSAHASKVLLGSLTTLALLSLTACGNASSSSSSARSTAVEAASSAAVPAARARFTSVSLTIAPGNAGEPFNVTHTLTLPKGWGAEVWARVPGARFALWTPQHQLLVSAADSGELIELIPAARAAERPRQRVLLSGLTMPQGMAFDTRDGVPVLYLAQSNQIDRYRWRPDGLLGPKSVIVANLPDTGPANEDTHRLKSLAIGTDHTIYVSVGSVSNAKAPDPKQYPPRATILSFDPSGGDMRVIARGVRNGEGLAFAPDGSLWTAVNERDEVTYPYHRAFGDLPEAFGQLIRGYVNEHPPDEIARLTPPGRNLGWPFCNPDPDDTPGSPERGLHYGELGFVADALTNPGERVLDCKTLPALQRGLPAHSAPLGLTFLQGSAIDSPWSAGAVLAVHGSWDRTSPRAPALLWLGWESATHTLAEPITLLSGFQDPAGIRWGRPVDAVPGPEGALYVTDDLAGAVYRVGPEVR